MSEPGTQAAASSNETEIKGLIDRWAKAVREENRAAIRADHDPDMLMFDSYQGKLERFNGTGAEPSTAPSAPETPSTSPTSLPTPSTVPVATS